MTIPQYLTERKKAKDMAGGNLDTILEQHAKQAPSGEERLPKFITCICGNVIRRLSPCWYCKGDYQ